MQLSSSNLATVTLPALLLAACGQSGKEAAVDYTLTVESGIGAGGPVNSAGLRIRPNGDFVWTGIYGEMEGQATEADSGTWDLQVTEGRGAYEPLEGGTGRLSTGEGGEYSVDGEGPAESLHVSGRVLTPAEANALFEASCSKAAVVFSNPADCGVTVTVDGVELGPIGTHYHKPDAMCDASFYNPTVFGGDYIETAESQLLCVEIDLAGAEPFDQCVSAFAILDKGREYSYTMAWENGETAEGSFRTGAGCEATFVCPPAPAGDGECAGADGGGLGYEIISTVMVQPGEKDYVDGQYTFTSIGTPYTLDLDSAYTAGGDFVFRNSSGDYIRNYASVTDGAWGGSDPEYIYLLTMMLDDIDYTLTTFESASIVIDLDGDVDEEGLRVEFIDAVFVGRSDRDVVGYVQLNGYIEYIADF